MPSTLDHYAVLGVLPDAEDIVIRAAYKALAQRYHPDRFDGPAEEAHIRMVELNEAYAILSDPAKRREYDRVRSSKAQHTQSASKKTFGEEPTSRQRTGRRYYGKPTFRRVKRESYYLTEVQGAVGGLIFGVIVCNLFDLGFFTSTLYSIAFAGVGRWMSLIKKADYYDEVEITSICLKCGGIGQVTAMDGTYIGFQCPKCNSSWKKRDRGY